MKFKIQKICYFGVIINMVLGMIFDKLFIALLIIFWGLVGILDICFGSVARE